MTEIVRFTSIPIIADASRSCATARIALPCFVCRTNQVRSRSSGTTIRIAASLFHWYVIPPISITSVRGMKFGTERKLTP